MKKIILASILFSLMFFVCGSEADATAGKTKPIQGQVVSLDDVIKGVKNLQLSKDRASELVEQKVPLVFKVGTKIYFVQNEDGSFAFKRLASFASNKKVGIYGRMRTVSGINVIIMTDIQSMD
jgi:hypothetical protein